ncbi:MAG: zinc ribbon domain-containing protein [Firmicutes bacterium]|nr:zinc ribbon domain-containing protein [Bacillota bacterium]
MFCNKCGKEMPDSSVFCSSCGASQQGGAATAQTAYRAPDWEFRTEKCYPSDAVEKKRRELYENCGWTIIDMDRKQTYEGQTFYGAGVSTKNYSTSTYIKMQRDRNHPHYQKMKELSPIVESYYTRSAPTKDLVKNSSIGTWVLLGFTVLPIIGWFVAIGLGISQRAKNDRIEEENEQIEAAFERKKPAADEALAELKKLLGRT